MSILKSIMHHWNKTTKSYDTLHPETESAQITDWHSGIMASLASKTLGTVVDAITTDSVLGKLIKMLLDASGVKYLIDTNGYVCFGSLFGGLIIQWGNIYTNSEGFGPVNFPLSYTQNCFGIYAMAEDTKETHEHISYYNLGKSSCMFYTETNESSKKSLHCLYFSVGY